MHEGLPVSERSEAESSECHDLPLLEEEELLQEEGAGEAHDKGKLCSRSTAAADFLLLGCGKSTGRRGFGKMRTPTDTRSFIE
jgi:hypothetical protein